MLQEFKLWIKSNKSKKQIQNQIKGKIMIDTLAISRTLVQDYLHKVGHGSRINKYPMGIIQISILKFTK